MFLLLIVCLSGCENGSSNKRELPKAEKEVLNKNFTGAHLGLNKKHHDFGKIDRNKNPYLEIDFEIENQGKSPLVITKTDVSCGCLSVDCSKEPILPGKKTKLIVRVDTRAQEGAFNKPVFIQSNADNDLELIRIVGEVDK